MNISTSLALVLAIELYIFGKLDDSGICVNKLGFSIAVGTIGILFHPILNA